MSETRRKFAADRPPIGWDGKTLREMLEESERAFEQTGRYCSIEKLSLKESDPIRYEKIFAKLRGGLVNARETAMNISASPIVKEIGELCFAFYTPEGDSVALSTGIIVHVHTMSDAIKFMIRHDYERNPRVSPGDIFTNNDPDIGDVHNADVQTFVPIFWENELIGWAGGVTHVTDIGAATPGSVPVGPTSRYEDGLQLTALKIGEEDTIYRDHELRCERAVRTPMYWKLDERTRIAGCHMIRDAIEKIIAEEGLDTFKKFMREVIEEGRRTFIDRIKELTIPGRYAAGSFFANLFKDEPGIPPHAQVDTLMHAPTEITISSGGEFQLSMDGASPWGYHSSNCTPSAMQGALWVLLSQTVIPNDKINDGAYLATRSFFPPGTWTNPQNLAVSTGAAWGFLIPGFTGMFRLLARAFWARGYHEEVMASYGMTMNALQGGGTNHLGKPCSILNFEISTVGGGACAVKDGLDYAAAMWNPEGDMADVEIWEIIEPLIYLGRRVKPNTAGPGKYRGGSGFESLRMVWKTDDLVLQNAGDGILFSSSGIFGGYPAATGYRHNVHETDLIERARAGKPYPVREHDPEHSELKAHVEGNHFFDKRTVTYPHPFKQGDLYLSWLRGGGGLGDPLEREPKLVAEDVNQGFLLPRYAPKTYGVKLIENSDGSHSVDLEGTRELRKEIRKTRAERSISTRAYMDLERQRVQEGEFIEPIKECYNSCMELSPQWAKQYREFWDLPSDFTFSLGDGS
ncbi:MAG: hydantoinase B/oxoprolinase family protein [Candidatus Abyssubacteria bacterium]|nr:hydantoinase B/oxoprolinase family protein [Candidatus Abyssubacteria bacterium]